MNTPNDIQHLRELSELSPEEKRKMLLKIAQRERRFEASCLRRMNTGGVHVREFNADDCDSYSPQYGNIMPSLRSHRCLTCR